MVSSNTTTLTERQVEILGLREEGHTQQEVAEMLGTTDSNVSAIERAAKQNVEKARRTLELIQALRSPVRFDAERGTTFDELVDEVYRHGDETGTKIAYCRPELYAHLYGILEEYADQNRLEESVKVGLTREGDVKVFADNT